MGFTKSMRGFLKSPTAYVHRHIMIESTLFEEGVQKLSSFVTEPVTSLTSMRGAAHKETQVGSD